MKVSKYLIHTFTVIAVFVLSPIAKAEQNGKWLDYGIGMINLNHVSQISPIINSDLCRNEMVSNLDLEAIRNSNTFECVYAIKFDDFILPLITTNLQKTFSHPELIQYNVERQSAIMENIRKFLDGNDTYMMVK